MTIAYSDANRIGDHFLYISDVSKIKSHYSGWTWKYGLMDIMNELHDGLTSRLQVANSP